jgi:hypothetical protein
MSGPATHGCRREESLYVVGVNDVDVLLAEDTVDQSGEERVEEQELLISWAR